MIDYVTNFFYRLVMRFLFAPLILTAVCLSAFIGTFQFVFDTEYGESALDFLQRQVNKIADRLCINW